MVNTGVNETRRLSNVERWCAGLATPVAWFVVNTAVGRTMTELLNSIGNRKARKLKRDLQRINSIAEVRDTLGPPASVLRDEQLAVFAGGGQATQPKTVERFLVNGRFRCDVWLAGDGKILNCEVAYFGTPFWWHVAISREFAARQAKNGKNYGEQRKGHSTKK